MLESPPVGTEPEVTLGVRAALLEAECMDLRARIEAREQRIRLLEEALRVLKANTYGPSRERLSVAAGQDELFNEIEAHARARPKRSASSPSSKPPRCARRRRAPASPAVPSSPRICRGSRSAMS